MDMDLPGKIMLRISGLFNRLAGASVVVMMLLTSADVVLRLFGRPIPGTYELVGFLGTLVVSFALARTALEKGNIAVDILVEKFSRRVQSVIGLANDLLGAALFGLIGWQSLLYALELKQSGEVSLTLGMPVYPFALGIAAGCGLLTLALLSQFPAAFGRAVRS
jgi:TRAP-type C4-dicarboxylate transport system permease small subunit